MKLTVIKPPHSLSDGESDFVVKDHYPSGRKVFYTGKTAGWQFWVGPYLVSLLKKVPDDL
jgi:hypothetical protein